MSKVTTDPVRVELTAMSPGGEAVGRVDGLVIFVRYALPDEIVEAAITHRRRNYARGSATRIVRSSSERVLPRCPHFGVCGGCDWQHADYAAQVRFKTEIVREQLERIGKLSKPTVHPCIPCPLPYGYRNHTQVALSADGTVGYYVAGTHQVTPITTCPILHPNLEKLLQHLIEARLSRPAGLREIHLRTGVETGEQMLVFEFESGEPQRLIHHIPAAARPAQTAVCASIPNGDSAVAAGAAVLRERIGQTLYTYSPTSFFQVNTSMIGPLIENVLRMLELGGSERVLELYCGAGLFTVPIAARAAFTLGIESNSAAARDAQRNLNGSSNAAILVADVRRALRDSRVRDQRWDRIVIDPPRTGVDTETLGLVAALGVSRIVYVSCEPATLARDARRLGDAGYRVVCAQPLDMFPQTHHVETVAVFER
ncbi:MAG: 23S rRNA (uracil(1939)-C(5))-methyltransferase RlmD [Anaerolineae bacterium]|nr:23S rRNA (uracil(1939)-C(5))-methyltransferase RlmD [Thermoflexales bacterium]MDW8406961.1 23S rRNA (uracil(1939)-C(5))-methyltransferase RlmD [Anaerolineae bacterium]